MHRLCLFTPSRIRGRACQFHALRAIIGLWRRTEFGHRRPHQTLTFILQLAKLPDLPDTNIRLADITYSTISQSVFLGAKQQRSLARLLHKI